ncbi:hypothetical protein P152DRAFT_484566 [Eremomyces bilateralis CBS 781.70]|uniref:Uncharacterized protein n=1 Tax=Eremomyces bilateralis CBS 781.70 TaxID=1392243 RepID=A0A6G1FUS6_9PEZI|nr:uncharacterized protein P152DRAFT_484566 [Eremomyces bilateralis CBS 781.70]KAF1809458.1 hypothetical protein P152DRAFT_484566 [Eremomyces bilateralis CBS 781.70]
MVIKGSKQPTYVLLNDTLPSTGSHSQLLGPFVANPLSPTDEYAPDDHSIITEIFSSLSPNLEAARSSSPSNSRQADWYVDTPRILTRRLTQHRRVFQSLMRDQEIKAEALDLLENNGGIAYMAVVTRSFTDAKVVENGGVQKELEGSVAVPLDKLAGDASVPPPAVPNLTMSGKKEETTD